MEDLMKPWVVCPNGPAKRVKDLGWLLRHAADVERITVILQQSGQWDCHLYAYLKDGRSYSCGWASRRVCRDWLRRPRFAGVPLNWDGVFQTTCDAPHTGLKGKWE
jgi:hypothetical protein